MTYLCKLSHSTAWKTSDTTLRNRGSMVGLLLVGMLALTASSVRAQSTKRGPTTSQRRLAMSAPKADEAAYSSLPDTPSAVQKVDAPTGTVGSLNADASTAS